MGIRQKGFVQNDELLCRHRSQNSGMLIHVIYIQFHSILAYEVKLPALELTLCLVICLIIQGDVKVIFYYEPLFF